MSIPKGEIKSIWLPAKIKAALQAWAESKGVHANALAAALIEEQVLGRVMETRYFTEHLSASGFDPSEYEAPRTAKSSNGFQVSGYGDMDGERSK